MSALLGDFTDCSVLLYDMSGNHLGSTVIREHDKKEQQIKVNLMPTVLRANDNCRVFILSSPTPCEFSGKLKKIGGSLIIAMFQGQEKENRGAMRYPVNTSAKIEALIIDEQSYYLQTPVDVTLINISTSGVRFRAPFYSLIENDVFMMDFIISNANKTITAEVVNCMDKGTESSDYGCRFVEIQ